MSKFAWVSVTLMSLFLGLTLTTQVFIVRWFDEMKGRNIELVITSENITFKSFPVVLVTSK